MRPPSRVWRVEFAPSAARDFRKLRGPIRDRVEAKVNSLAANPRPPGVEKLAGADDLYRVRVGDFRIIYEIHDDRLLVLVLKIADRKDAYR
jgi:mRNA interferase RelE/StbE